MSNPRYGQYCGLARALELVGERWGLLVVRDLLVGPRRFSELHAGLPKISSNVLTTRLKELEAAGIIRRQLLPRPERGFHYELTEYGRDLEEAVAALGRWGARALGEPGPDDVVTSDSFAMALRSTFRADQADDIDATFQVHVGQAVASARVAAGEVEVWPGPAEAPDVIIEGGPGLRAVMAGEVEPGEALAAGVARIEGDRRLFDAFTRLFRLGPTHVCDRGAS